MLFINLLCYLQPAQTVAAPQSNVAADIKPREEPPPAYQPSAAQQVDTSELQRRQEELERKAAELQEREQRMRERTVAGGRRCMSSFLC